jgi:DnaJ-class molecular chaperone
MSSYADMPNKDIADKIVALWEQINENAHNQHRAKRRGDAEETARLVQEEITLHIRISNLGLELAKKIIEARPKTKKCHACDGTGISMLLPVKPNSYFKCETCGGTGELLIV